jgi:hypothetical protein
MAGAHVRPLMIRLALQNGHIYRKQSFLPFKHEDSMHHLVAEIGLRLGHSDYVQSVTVNPEITRLLRADPRFIPSRVNRRNKLATLNPNFPSVGDQGTKSGTAFLI